MLKEQLQYKIILQQIKLNFSYATFPCSLMSISAHDNFDVIMYLINHNFILQNLKIRIDF